MRLFLSSFFVGVAVAVGAVEKSVPPGGVPVVSTQAITTFRNSGRPEHIAVQRFEVTGQPFHQAVRVQTKVAPMNVYDLQLGGPNIAPVKKGDALLASFWVRGTGGSAEQAPRVNIVFERNGAPHTKSVEGTIPASADWKRINLPFRAEESYGTNGARLAFRFGFDPQVIELAEIELLNFGTRVAVRDLPNTSFSYAGREVNAPWRSAALERIERIRKGDLTIEVRDRAGKPVPNAKVEVNMMKHQFGWGSAVAAEMLLRESDDGRRYRDTVLKLYNKVVFENDLKWTGWENTNNRAVTLRAIDWLQRHDIAIRGHCLVWPSWQHTRGLQKLTNEPAALRARIAAHVRDEASALKGKLAEWDVINEPFSNHDVMDVLGNDVMVEWFKIAHEADPAVKLFINDYDILTRDGTQRAHQDHYEKTIRFLIDRGAPLNGIGFQGHFGGELTPPEKMLKILDRFAAFGKPIQITEHDINVTDEELQADFTRDFLITLFSHESVSGVLTWGFWEGRHWRPNGAYFAKDWSVKPAGQAWMDLVLKQWWTKTNAVADAGGAAKIRGFLGDYEVRAEVNGRVAKTRATLERGGSVVRVTIE